MDIGVSLVFADEHPIADCLSKVASAGFKQVELGDYDNPSSRWWQDPLAMKRALAGAGLAARTVHSPGAGWNNGDPDEATRLASVDEASSIFRPSAEAGVEVVHPNTPDGEEYTEEGFEASLARSVDSLTILAERAAEAGVKLAVENLPRRHTPRPGGFIVETLRMIDGLGDHVGICFDVGHSNANVPDPADEVRAAGDKILCVHIHDNDGIGGDQHLIPGEGTVTGPRSSTPWTPAPPTASGTSSSARVSQDPTDCSQPWPHCERNGRGSNRFLQCSLSSVRVYSGT